MKKLVEALNKIEIEDKYADLDNLTQISRNFENVSVYECAYFCIPLSPGLENLPHFVNFEEDCSIEINYGGESVFGEIWNLERFLSL